MFPGGAGIAEEILYLLGILLHPDNAETPFPLIFTGPESSADYFKQINAFIGDTLAYLRSFYWRKSLIYGFRLILTQKFPLKSMVFF